MRFFDVLFSLTALIFLTPLLLPVMLLLRVTGEGEIFYAQTRVGMHGKPFKLFKFATMLKDSPNIGAGTITVQNDPRILPLGKLLRKTKVNELPQVFNVLRGEMSLIGPRPLTVNNFNYYSVSEQKIISEFRPGLSGIGSLVFRNEEDLLPSENVVEFYQRVVAPYKATLENWYFNNRNLKSYFLLIFITIWVVIRPKSEILWRVFPDLPKPSHSALNRLSPVDH